MKRYFVGFILTAGVFSASAATIIGSDDFNDNAVDNTKWQQTDAEGSASFTEDNQQLEYISGSTGFEFIEWTWSGGNPSYSQDWSVQVELDLVYLPQEFGDEHFFGLSAQGNGYSFDLHYASYYNQAYLETDVFGPGDTDISDTESEVSSSSVTLKISFDATTKIFHSSYSSGGGFIPLSSYSAASFGMTDSSTFTLKLWGESSGMVMDLDDAVFDNFQIYEAVVSGGNFSGADTFNDNTVDPSRWSISSEGLGVLSEVNGRLEFSGHSDEAETDWILNAGSYTQDWTVVIDAHNSDSNRLAGMGVSFGPGNSWVIIENSRYTDLDYLNEHAVISGFGTSEEGEYFGHFIPITNDFVKLGLSFDSNAKILYGAFDGGNGFVIVTNHNISSVGMGDGDTFSLVLYAGTDGAISVTPGTLYFDNFLATSNAGFLESDSDGDGLDLLEERIAGTDPNSAGSVFEVSDGEPSPSGFILNWEAITGRVYTVEWTDSLTNSFQTLEPGIAHPQNSYTDTVHTVEGEGFYNLKVELAD